MWNSQRRGARFPAEDGGSLNQKTWVNNPQFFLEMHSSAEFVLTLHQDDLGGDLHSVGLLVAKHDWGADRGRVPKFTALSNEAVRGLSAEFVTARQVTLELGKLEKGKYAVVPMTFEPTLKGGGLWLQSTSLALHTLLGEPEVMHNQPLPGHAHNAQSKSLPFDHLQIEDSISKTPTYEDGSDQETAALEHLAITLGKMWTEAHKLTERTLHLKHRANLIAANANKQPSGRLPKDQNAAARIF